MRTPFLAFALLASLSIGALVWGLYGLWRQHLDPRQKALAQRLQAATRNGPRDETEPTLKLRSRRLLSQWTWAERRLQILPGMAAFDHFLLQTGLTLSLSLLRMAPSCKFSVTLSAPKVPRPSGT